MSHACAVETELQPRVPQAPESVADVGVRKVVLEDLALKILCTGGPLSLRELATRAHLRYSVVHELLVRLRAERLCEVTGMTGNIPHIAITGSGRSRAVDLLALNQYVGPAPVSLESYVLQVRQQGVHHLNVHAHHIHKAFSHLVLDPATLTKLGTALNSGSSIFLYGPTGTGKTAIATALSHLFVDDGVWVPHALEIEGQIIAVYDPHVHIRLSDSSSEDDTSDPRWVLCRRPTVVVGGELTMEMLELQFDPATKFYTAPGQMKANNGVLIIDDFGRQRLRPEELLNRWVVPLDRRIDFLTLAGGKKVEIPFELFVVFATNVNPATLADAAFLRRIQTKIKVGNASRRQFHEIFRRVCHESGLQCSPDLIDELIDIIQKQLKEPLRACHPRDLVNQVQWAARYERKEPRLDRESLMIALQAYFVDSYEENDN